MSTISPVELLQNLIRFNTTNPPGNEAECIAYINNLLTQAGFETTLVARASERPNLITRLKGQGTAAPLLLFGHIDVQPTEGQDWQYPPFEGKIAEGCIWGRGTLDMKGGVAMMLTALLRAKAEGLAPSGDVVLAVLSDEERLGDYGAKYVVENHASLFEGVHYAISEVGGFTLHMSNRRFYPIQVQEKQSCFIRANIRWRGGHGMIRLRGTHMSQLAHMLLKLEKHRTPVHITSVARQMIEAIASAQPFPASIVLRQLLNPGLANIVLRLLGSKGQAVEPLIRNIMCPSSVNGRWLPSEIALEIWGALLPGYGPDDMIAELRPILGEEMQVEVVRFDPGPPATIDMGLFDTLAGILREADPEGMPVPFLLPAPSDARLFARLGIQTYGFTPMKVPPSPNFWELPHAADERIPVEAVQFGADMIYKLIQRYT